MEKEEVLKRIKAAPGSKVKFAIVDIDGILRGKYIHKDKFFENIDQYFGFCDVVYGWDSQDELYSQNSITGWETGFPDGKAFIDLESFRMVPWDQNVPFFLADYQAGLSSRAVCPRSLLKRVNQKAEQMGLFTQFSMEYEWFNFKADENQTSMKPEPVSKGMFGYSLIRMSHGSDYFNAIFDDCEAFDISLEGLHTETGPGVFEAAIRKDDILKAADKGMLFKTAIKEIGYKHGIMPSFMAKWSKALPGCSGHMHQSLWDDKGKSLFYDTKDPFHMSPLMKSYLAGQLHCLSDLMPMFAPTVNSYKRLVEGAWAPTTASWGVDNRTTALRVLQGSESSTRIEHRVPGADVNPYLCMAAGLASGIYGIENNLKLEDLPVSGNAYAMKELKKLPSNLYEAVEVMKHSDIARELLGKEFVDHMVMTREHEWQQYLNEVSNWELKRYFEII